MTILPSLSYTSSGFRVLDSLQKMAVEYPSINTFLKGTKKIISSSIFVGTAKEYAKDFGSNFGEFGKYLGNNIASSYVGLALDEINLLYSGKFFSIEKQTEKSIKAICGATCKVGTGFMVNPLFKIPIKSVCVAFCDVGLGYYSYYDKKNSDNNLSFIDGATIFVKGFGSSVVKESLDQFSSVKEILKGSGVLGEWGSGVMNHFGGLFTKIAMDKYESSIKDVLQYSSEKISYITYSVDYFVKGAASKYQPSITEVLQYSSDKISSVVHSADYLMKFADLTNKYFYDINYHSDIKIDNDLFCNDDFVVPNSTDPIEPLGILPDLFTSMIKDITHDW